MNQTSHKQSHISSHELQDVSPLEDTQLHFGLIKISQNPQVIQAIQLIKKSSIIDTQILQRLSYCEAHGISRTAAGRPQAGRVPLRPLGVGLKVESWEPKKGGICVAKMLG